MRDADDENRPDETTGSCARDPNTAPRTPDVVDTRAVSPVIGVILMVAITVILAAVVGTFVIGLGDKAGDTAPQASLGFEFTNKSAFTIAFEGGDPIDTDQLTVKVGSDEVYNDSSLVASDGWEKYGPTWGDTLTAGSTQTLYDSDSGEDYSGETVRIIWESPKDGTTNTIAKAEWP